MIEHLFPKFHVVSMVSNPVRFINRPALYKQFCEHMASLKVSHYKVDVAFGDRAHYLTDPEDPRAVRLRCYDEWWVKENAINLGIQRLPDDWEYVAWVDGDITFVNPEIIAETIHELQHHPVVQMFQTAVDMGPNGEALQIHQGFGHCVQNGTAKQVNWKPYYIYPHTGFAWAIRRDAFDAMGALIDRAALGSGDHHMAWGMIGKASDTCPRTIGKHYKHMVETWGNRAFDYIKGNVGYVTGTVLHHWHGRKVDRKYTSRWQTLVENKFDPYEDLKPNWQGVLHLTGNKPEMAQAFRNYFRQRNEDAKEL